MANQFPHFYETEVQWTEQKKGELISSGLPALEVATPPQFQGHEGMWSPEHYFIASINGCLSPRFWRLVRCPNWNFVSFSAKAQGKLDQVAGQGLQITEIVLRPQLVIRYSRDLERAGRILEKAEKNCLISNSVKTHIKLEPELLRAEE